MKMTRGWQVWVIGILLVAGRAEAADPSGYLDAANCSAIAGWAYDADTSAQSIDLHLYDGNTFVAAYKADQARSDVNAAFGITGNHGFVITTPSSLRNGQSHTLHVYAINTGPGNNLEIANSPQTVTCAQAWTNPTIDVGEAIGYRDFRELRQAIEQRLANCSVSAVTWAQGPIDSGVPIRAEQLNELRTVARSRLILPSPYNAAGGFANEPATTSTPIRATHVIQLREALDRAGCPPAACACTPWVNGNCAAGGCGAGQRQQTRTCAPAGCQTQSQCVADASCPTGPICPGNGCEAGEDCNNCPQDCGGCPPGGGGGGCGSCTPFCGSPITCYFTEYKTGCRPDPVYGECCDCCACIPSGEVGSQCCCSGNYHYETRNDQTVAVCD